MQNHQLKPSRILHNAVAQWSLNNELLKTSHTFYKEFAKIYSIVVNDDEAGDEAKSTENLGKDTHGLEVKTADKDPLRNYLKKGDKTIIDILKLNYNALSSFLLFSSINENSNKEKQPQDNLQKPELPQQEFQQIYRFISTNTTDMLQKRDNKEIYCLSSSLESLISSINITAENINSISTSVIATAATTAPLAITTFFLDTFNECAFENVVNRLFTNNITTTDTFLKKLCLSKELVFTDSVVIFDIRNKIPLGKTTLKVPNSWSLHAKRNANRTSSNSITSINDTRIHETAAAVVANEGGTEGIVGKLFSMFGSLFSKDNSHENSLNDLTTQPSQSTQSKTAGTNADLFLTNGEDCKKLLLKLFEVTMAICIKGYKNEEVGKMQKHLYKLKLVILSNAKAKWQHYSEDGRENPIVQALQTLLKIAELSSPFNEKATAANSSSGNLTANSAITVDETILPVRTQITPTTPHATHLLQRRKNYISATTPGSNSHRPLSGVSADADYFSTQASNICADSEVELSENDKEDNFLSADEGYEADGEIPEISASDAEVISTDLCYSLHPTSRYRTHVLHNGLSRLVVEILMELSQLCAQDPLGWCDRLAQLANRLFVVREFLGGPLFLLKGFTPVLSCNDPRLKELQQSILLLITDLNTPEILCEFYNILSSKQPPVEILLKSINYLCTNSLKRAQPKVELEFPVIIDGKCISTSDVTITEHIDRIRNYHLHSQIVTPFNRAPCFIPITHARIWNNEGITLSMWLQVKNSQSPQVSNQNLEYDISEEYIKSHLVSIGTDQAMLSVYINNNLNLIFETCRPNGEIHQSNQNGEVEEESVHSDTKYISKKNQHHNMKNFTNYTVSAPSSNVTPVQHGISPLRNALKNTKLALLNSFNNMPIFNGHAENSSYESSCVELKLFRLTKNKWTHLVFAVETHAEYLNLTITIDGLEQHSLTLGFQNFQQISRSHEFQVISLGDGIPVNKVSHNCSDSQSTFEACVLRTSISNLILFNRYINLKNSILNLTAMGADFTEITQCQVGNWKPNYGYLNLSKINKTSFGKFGDSMKSFKEARILTYTAVQPEFVMGYEPNMELDNASYGRPYGLILYGELSQNQIQSIQTATLLSGGLSTLLYMFARVVEISNSSSAQSMALDFLLSVALSESQLYTEFLQNDYLNLIGYVVKTERCTKDVYLLTTILNNACSQPVVSKKGDMLQVYENTTACLVYPRFIVSILHRYSDWHRSGAENSEVLDLVFTCILALTREKHPHRDFNIDQLNKAGLVNELLILCKIYVIESPSPVYISQNAAKSFVNILSVFGGSPPSSSLMDEIMKLLLLLHKPSECYITHDRNKFYFLLTPQTPTREKLPSSNFTRVTSPFHRNNVHPIPGIAVTVKSPAKSTELDPHRAERIDRIRKLHTKNLTYKSTLNDFEENLNSVADCCRLNKVALHLLSPVEVERWRSKFKRLTSYSTTHSPLSPRKISTPIKSIKLQSPRAKSIHRLSVHKIVQHNATTSVSSSLQSLAASLVTYGKTDFYNSLGIIALQEGLFLLLKDFLCLLPDNVVDDVLKHYIKVEFLLVLSNHSSCGVRSAIIKLLTALTQRLPQNELQLFFRNFYPHHLANQISIYPTDTHIFVACVEWVTGVYGNLDTISEFTELHIRQQFGLNALLAITTKLIPSQIELIAKAFNVLRIIYLTNSEEHSALIESGLLQCCVKALYNLYSKQNLTNSTEDAILQLLTSVGESSLKSIGHINVLWDILNLLSFYQEKQPATIVKNFRSVQAKLQLNWLGMFFCKTKVPWNFKVIKLPDCTFTLAESKIRLDLLIDRCSQFFTVFDANNIPSESEVKLFEFLVSYGISTNQRCNNFIAWGLQPSRPRDLRNYIVDALWISCRDDFLPSIICDGKMIKSLLWLSLLEDLEPSIENLPLLCNRLGINENDSTWNLENELSRIELNRSTVSAKQKSLLEKTLFKFESLAINCIESSMVTTRRVAELQNAERKLLMNHMKDYDDTYAYSKWLEIIRRMTHEGAPWYCKERFGSSWELDATEGPSRVHTRLKRCQLDIDKRFVMEDYRATRKDSQNPIIREEVRSLDFLTSSYDQQLNISLNSQILYNFPAKYLPVDGEIDGEIIVTDHKLYFLATYRCKYFYVACDIGNITEIWLKRYQHREKAFEIFLDTNQSLFFSLQNQEDWKILRDVFRDKIITQPDQNKLQIITQQWREGLLTNWEYLMTLNQIAGRTYNDLMQYPVFPWILSNYSTEMLDLTNPTNFRKLEKPIAVQNEDNELHYITNYNYLRNTMTNMGSIILKPYHYSSHYSNSGTVLHFLVRVPPFTSYFLRYQDNNFDLPDRTFHSLNTTWCLASRDSPTDVKELIPEFFCLPEMFENFERFNFGCRQSGERVEDVLLPPWCLNDPRLFIFIHRQALECEFVRNNLHNWIDLIFGFKQSGESAVDAINVFHPATYSMFLEAETTDPIERKAVETMIKTYGQMPRQLFKSAHAASKGLNYSLGEKQLLKSVLGLRWGAYLGSPQLPKPMLGNIHKLLGAEYLVSFNNTNVVYGLPKKSCIMQGAEIDTFNVISWGYEDRIVRIQPLNKIQAKPKNLIFNDAFDDITACGTDPNSNQLWFGHKSGRISIYKCANIDQQIRSGKSRQSYVHGLRLSYNSAFRKIASKSNTSIKIDDDLDNVNIGFSLPAGAASGVDVLHRDGADLTWNGPTILVRHTDEISCIQLSVDFKIAVTAGRDGLAVIWDLNDWSYIRTIERPAEIHHSPITYIALSPTMGDIVTVHTLPFQNSINEVKHTSNQQEDKNSIIQTEADECFEVTEENLDDFVNVSINPNGKSILRLHTVNGRYVRHIVHEDSILAVCYSYIKEGVGVNVIATALEGGIVRLWSSWNLSFVSEIITGLSNIKSLTYSTHQHLVVLTKDSHIQVWESEGLYGGPPKFPQIAYK